MALGKYLTRDPRKDAHSSSLGVLCYDYCLTLRREVELFWTRSFHVTALLFYFNRYGSVVSSILVVVLRFQTHWTQFPQVRI